MHKMKRPTIGLVVPSLEQGGGVPSVAEFVYTTIERAGKYDVRIVSLATSAIDSISSAVVRPKTWFHGPQVESSVWRGRPFTRVGASMSEFEFQRYRPRPALARAIQECDIIQVVCGSPAWANAVVGLGKPVSLQVATRAKIERRRRDSKPSSAAGWWRKTMTYVTDKLDDRALLSVDAIQLENPWMLNYTVGINKARDNVDIRYAPPGVDADVFCPLPDRRTSASPYILCVGRLNDPRKNVNLLLDAFASLPSAFENVRLITAGSGAPPEEYWAKVKAMGLANRVQHILRPETSELVRLYQNAAVFVLTSDEEGLGVVILEAMACAIPVVCTRCGGPDGIVTHGKDGYLVPLDDAASLSHHIGLLCSDWNLNRQMGESARKTITSRFADELAGNEFVRVWDALLERSGAI
jgi:glycosyltransferase involved in cell wall biosynthesis